MSKDIFGFESAIQIDHLTEDQLQQVAEILKGLK